LFYQTSFCFASLYTTPSKMDPVVDKTVENIKKFLLNSLQEGKKGCELAIAELEFELSKNYISHKSNKTKRQKFMLKFGDLKTKYLVEAKKMKIKSSILAINEEVKALEAKEEKDNLLITEKLKHIEELFYLILKVEKYDENILDNKLASALEVLKDTAIVFECSLITRKDELKCIDNEMRNVEMYVQQYLAYAIKHDIKFNLSDTFDLFRQCNRDYHITLIANDWRAQSNFNCKGKIDCLQSYELEYTIDKKKCVYIAYGNCQCGYSEWKHMDPPNDLEQFNLNSKHTYGSMEKK
jgi:hypothetical protein